MILLKKHLPHPNADFAPFSFSSLLSSPASECLIAKYISKIKTAHKHHINKCSHQGTSLRAWATCATSPSTTAPWQMMLRIAVWWERRRAPQSSS